MQKNPPEENVEEDTRVAGAAADEAAALVAEVDAETLANQTASGGGASTSGGAGKPMGATPAMVDRPVDGETAPEPAPEEPQDGDYGQSILELKAEMEEMSVMLASANKEKDAAEAKLRALPSVDLLSESSMEVFSIDDAIAVRDVVLSGSPLVKEALPETTAFSLGMPSAAFNCGAKSLYTLRAGYEESGADQILGYTADVLGRIVMPTMAIDPGTMEHATALAESLGTEEDHVLDTEVNRALAANSIMAPDTPAGPVPTMRESSEYIADLDLQYFGVDGSFKTRHHQSKGRLMSMPVFSTADPRRLLTLAPMQPQQLRQLFRCLGRIARWSPSCLSTFSRGTIDCCTKALRTGPYAPMRERPQQRELTMSRTSSRSASCHSTASRRSKCCRP